MKNIRNFCIIAHIDHGKSTLADRFLEVTGTIEKREMKHDQILDTMELEQERGITIKLQPVRMEWKNYVLNLIDTPGHVDFTYEVSRSIAACEGAILVIDATQGVQAQTLANVYLALEYNLKIIPVINKIDLPSADIEKCSHEIENLLAIPKDEIIAVSAKDGTNVEDLLNTVIERIPSPDEAGVRTQLKINDDSETKALIFDSMYDTYKGVVAYVRNISGSLKRGDTVYLLGSQKKIEVLEVGYFKPGFKPCVKILPGEVGYVVTGLKSVGEARVGDTVWKDDRPPGEKISFKMAKAIPGYKNVKPMVFAGIFCIQGDDFPLLRDALEKLSLSDSSFTFVPEQSSALGYGFRCGFLGLLHLEIIQQRLEREYDLDLIITAPGVSYNLVFSGSDKEKIKKNTGLVPDDDMTLIISNPAEFPDRTFLKEVMEPWMKLDVISPSEYIGVIMKLLEDRRGIYKNMQYLEEDRVLLEFEVPLANIVLDFYDYLKSITKGYGSMNYEFISYRTEDLIKLDILVGGEKVEALGIIVHRSEAYKVGESITKKLKESIPRAQFAIPLQAAIGGKIIARQTISAFRKDVIAKLYGGDRTRKDKLLKKQKEGKKRMRSFGKVNIPQEAFMAVLKR